MTSEEDSLVADTDEEYSDVEAPWRARESKLSENKRKPTRLIIESDDEDEVVSSDDEFMNDGRLTPSIKKAIRRSIFNISQQEIIDDSDIDNSNDAFDDNANNSNESDSIQLSGHSLNIQDASEQEISNTSHSDYSTSEARENDSQAEEFSEKSPLPPEKIAAVRAKVFTSNKPTVTISDSDDEVQVTNAAKSSNLSRNIVAIDSDSEKSIENYEDLPEVVSLAKQELNAPTLDPIIAQKRAMIVCQIQQIEREVKKTKIFLKEGNLNLLPDNGKKLRINIAKHQEKLEELRAELDSMPLVEIDMPNNQSEYAPPRSQNHLIERNWDPKSMLKPTANTNTGDFGKQALETFQREQALTVDRLEDLHGSLLSRPTEDTRAEDPRGLKVALMPHQQHALAWLLWREKQKPSGGVLADDMGLGKTLTMISLVMASLAKEDKDDDDDDDEDEGWVQRSAKYQGGTLVVCPASLVSQWEAEIKNRCKRGLLMVELYHGNNRETQARRLARNNIVITTYNLLSREYKNRGVIYNIDWKRVILDEAHVIRNHKSQACEAVCGILGRKRWALTGTPIHNKEMDLYAILKFLKCSPFDDLRVWKRWVDNKNSAGHERLAAVMKSLMLRRTKQELMNNGSIDTLPEKQLEVLNVELDRDERLIYEKILVYSRTLFAQFLHQRAEKKNNYELGAENSNGFMSKCHYRNTQFNRAQKELLARHADVKQHEILVLLLRLRQACCHPSLVHSMLDRDDLEVNGLEDGTGDDNLMNAMKKLNLSLNENEIAGEETDVGVDQRVVENLLTSDNPVFARDRKSSKLRAVLRLVKEIVERREKMIIVSQWTSNLEIVAEQLSSIKGATYKMFTGAVAVKNRQDIIDAFNSNGDPQILLLSLTAGGVGLNLVGANHLMLIDIHWNPQLESQAQDRIYRFGQKKNVFVYKFICTDTIEERIKNLQEKKLEIASTVLTGTRNNAGSKLSLDDLKSLFSL